MFLKTSISMCCDTDIYLYTRREATKQVFQSLYNVFLVAWSMEERCSKPYFVRYRGWFW